MRLRDRPTVRAGPTEEPLEEPIIIDMSMDSPEEEGANTRSPSPSIRTEKWPRYLLKRQKLELKWPGTRALSKGHLDQGAQARAHRRGARCSMPLTPKISDPGRLQSSQMLHRSQREGSRDRRGRQWRQSSSLERQEQVTQGERGRSRSQEAICDCSMCQTMPEGNVGKVHNHARSGRRRLRVLYT